MSLKFEQQQVPSDGWPIILHFTLHAKRLKQRHTHIVRERERTFQENCEGAVRGRREGISLCCSIFPAKIRRRAANGFTA